ncbi:hypothetical protein GCM10023083_46690 [Streptomyces phyllanthi]
MSYEAVWGEPVPWWESWVGPVDLLVRCQPWPKGSLPKHEKGRPCEGTREGCAPPGGHPRDKFRTLTARHRPQSALPENFPPPREPRVPVSALPVTGGSPGLVSSRSSR